MRFPTRLSSARRPAVLAAACAVAWSGAGLDHARGQVDNLAPVLTTNWFLGSSLAAYTYAPATDTMYVTAYGNPAVVRVTGVTPPASQSATPTVYESTLQLYYRNGDPNRGVTSPVQGGILLNPQPIGAAPAYSLAVIADGGNTRYPATSTVDPSATKKFYTYNLGVAAIPGDGTDVFTTRATLADLQAVAGTASTSNSLARQFAWSGDGQSIYFVDSSPAYGGLWKLGAVSGAPQRIVAGDMTNTEPGVFSSGGVDRVYFSGVSGTAGVGNAGGIDFVTHDGTTTSGVQVAVSAARLADFFERTVSSQRISSIAFAGADMFFGVWNSDTDDAQRLQGIYRLDAEGRISKVANRAQRTAAFGAVGQTFDRFQPREITYAGTANAFPVTQLLYREAVANTVAGAIAFKPVDFNRDDQVTAADLALFVPQVTIRGQIKATGTSGTIADLKFDMNGNDTVDWKDVQIVESFLDYAPDPTLAGRIVPALPIQADADLNGVVDFNDFLTMRGTYGSTSQPFTQGDYNGDNEVSFPDLQPWINSYGFRSAVVGTGVPMAPFDQAVWNQFLGGLTPPAVTLDVASGRQTQFQVGYRTIVIAASVTKTGTGTLVYDTANTYSGTTNVAAGTLELANPAAAATSRVTVAGGGRLAVAPAVVTTVAGLDLAPDALADVTNGGLTVASGLSPTDLVAQLLAGRADGSWTGTSGITSTTVAADVAAGLPRAVGWMDNGDGSLTAAYAAPGDTNLDWAVDVLDVANFVAGGKYNASEPATWFEGDFNYDGVVDIQDVADFGSTGLYSAGIYNPAATPAGGIAAVPEPVACWPIALAAVAVACRRRPAGS